MKLDAYIINLEHRKDRRAFIEKEITKLELSSHEFIKATYFPNDPELACTLSHLDCIKKAKDNKLERVLILEDDALFLEDCSHQLNQTFVELENIPWDMLFLGANLQAPSRKVSPSLIKLEGAFAAHAYVVASPFYDTLLSLPLNQVIDRGYHDLMPLHNIFLCNPMIAFQEPFTSDIQHSFKNYNDSFFYNFSKHVRS